MLDRVTRFKNKGIPLTDYHIHIRGGMSFEKALDWGQKTGIRSSAIENQGRDWPLSNDTAISNFIKEGRKFPELLIGIQVILRSEKKEPFRSDCRLLTNEN
jgi:hypothetical protein